MLNIKGIHKILLIIIVLLIIVGIIFSIYCLKVLGIKKIGININPSKIYDLQPDIKIFLQNDERWTDDTLGNSKYRLGTHGCLLSIIATCLNNLGYNTNPKELNYKFTQRGVYTSSGDIIWNRINKTIPNIVYDFKRVFNKNTIQRDLEDGFFPIVMVKYKDTGIFHWIIIVGSDEDEFLIVDPLNQNKDIIKLGVHGKVYAYRVLKTIDEDL